MAGWADLGPVHLRIAMSFEELSTADQASNRKAATELAQAVVQALDWPVAAAWLFGSGAQGRLRTSSDLDIALLLERPVPALELAAKAVELETLAERRVQFVQLGEATTILAHQVLTYGILLVDRQPRRRHEYVMRAMTDYLDLKLLRRSGEAALCRRLAHGR
jgi:predicted nucleotidyltransferase